MTSSQPANCATTASASRPWTKRSRPCASGGAEHPDHLQHVPAEARRGVLAEAAKRQVGILARVPLASGLLTGKLGRTPSSPPTITDRSTERVEAFDKGETLSGVPYEVGLAAVDELRPLVPPGASLTQLALRWILMFDGVTCAIPGARTAAQARENAASRGAAAARCRDDGRREAGLR